MKETSLPPYIAANLGLPIANAPFDFNDSKLSVLALECENAKVQGQLDKYINQPSNGEKDLRTFSLLGKSYVFLVMADMQFMASNNQNEILGNVKYPECSFWIPAFDTKNDEVCVFLPLLLLNSGTAIATGREVFGFEKQQATFDFFNVDNSLNVKKPDYQVNPYSFKTFGTDVEGQYNPLIKVGKSTSKASAAADTIVNFAADKLVGSIEEHFLKAELTVEGTDKKISLSDLFSTDIELPVSFLKQFPAISDVNASSFQEVTSAKFKLSTVHSAAPYFLPFKHQVTIFPLESHPIIDVLGINAEKQSDGSYITQAPGLWLDVNFSLELPPKPIAPIKPVKQKIAVLGSGMGSLSTVFGLTSEPNWQDKYDITIYQEGWRMGGKCASSRDPDTANRIEEHGLHIFFGFYDNAIKMMREAYEELGRPPEAPLADFNAAFKPHSFIAVQEKIKENWVTWPIFFPPNDQVPGSEDNYAQDSHDSPLGMMLWLLSNTKQHLKTHQQLRTFTAEKHRGIIDRLESYTGLFNAEHHHVDDVIALIDHVLDKAVTATEKDAKKIDSFLGELGGVLEIALDIFKQIFGPTAGTPQSIQQLILAMRFGFYIIKGMIADKVIFRWTIIDQYDFRQWLRNNGAPEDVVCSAIVRAFYDLYLAFPKGDTSDSLCGGNISAGTLLHAYFLSCGQYKGAIFWKMQAGMGETVIVPLYQALVKRGVKVEFFSRVSNLALSTDQSAIEQIQIDVQANIKETVFNYQPLIDVKGLPCWPKNPNYSQLVQGPQLEYEKVDLESPWSSWNTGLTKNLVKGTDFDVVVLGISVGALPFITTELMAASTRWNDMVTNVQSSQTQAMQIWLKSNLEQTGWKLASPVMDAYEDPFNTWADMSQTLDVETWPQNHLPKSVAYFCNNLDQPNDIPPFTDHDFPMRESLRVRENATKWLSQNTGHIWPYISDENGGLKWEQLVDLNDGTASPRTGVDRFDSQYWHAAINPSERYVLSVADTNKYRLKADESQFSNLIITGDWTDNGFLNIGCVESTVVSGLKASRAIGGFPKKIFYIDK